MERRVVLLTRPQAEAERTAMHLEAIGFEALIEPMLTIEPFRIDWPDPQDYAALAVTSAQALHQDIAKGWLGKPVFTVGQRTAAVAREKGFTDIRSADGDASDLAALMAESLPPGAAVLHPCGEDRGELPGVTPLPVYKAHAAERLSDALLGRLERIYAAMFFSPRTGRIFAGLAEKQGVANRLKATKALCFSAPVVQSVRALPWLETRVAARPRIEAMLDLLH